jgi:hypothetical protein
MMGFLDMVVVLLVAALRVQGLVGFCSLHASTYRPPRKKVASPAKHLKPRELSPRIRACRASPGLLRRDHVVHQDDARALRFDRVARRADAGIDSSDLRMDLDDAFTRTRRSPVDAPTLARPLER